MKTIFITPSIPLTPTGVLLSSEHRVMAQHSPSARRDAYQTSAVFDDEAGS